MKGFEIRLDMKKASVVLVRGDKSIAFANFLFDKSQITITDFDVYRYYRKKGYGTILMYFLMGLARAKRKAIYLYSVPQSVHFYEKVGFDFLKDYKYGKHNGKKVIIKNLNPSLKFDEQVDATDFIWIPPEMKQVSIYI